MPLDPRRVKALFNAALDLPDPAGRPAILERECGDDRELRQRLTDLLAAYDQPSGALDRPITESSGQTNAPDEGSISAVQAASTGDQTPAVAERTSSYRPETPPPPALIGSIIAGRYKLREEIGEGGMGSVYLAEQLQPVKRKVALKLIKVGMDSRTVLARFDSERQALALMDHPNIAKVLDAGTTETGRPFFVMELVKGIPLTEYCDQHRLGLMDRLGLFRQICSAVHHAHQKGIIHRDLKPSNILVESHDGTPVPKVIDFGLAKATSGLQLTEQSLYSAFGTVAGTPLYMAPEQATLSAIDIDTRADIYALGVILYELLTGSTPIERETFKKVAIDEMLRLIREVEPPVPSSRISTSEALPSLAATRQTEPSRLGRFIRGDLDWIVMKALAKERKRRYESAIAFAQDIDRFLSHEPVTAGPPTAAYRFKKFVRRNRPQVVAASLVLLALVGGIIGTTLGLLEARRQQRIAIAESIQKDNARLAEAEERKKAVDAERLARTEADKARAINEFLTKDLLTQAEPANNAAEDKVTLREVLDRAASKVGGRFTNQPEVGIELRKVIARTYHGLAAWAAAEAQWRAVLEAERNAERESATSYEAQSGLAHILRHRGRYDAETLAMAKEAADGLARTLGNDHPDTLRGMSNLACAYLDAGQIDRALPLFEDTLALSKSKLGPDHNDTLASMNNLASGYWKARKLDRSIPLFEECLKLVRVKLGEDHPDTLGAKANLGVNYKDAGRLGEALPLLEEANRAVRRDPTLRFIRRELLDAYIKAGRLDEAAAVAKEMVAEGGPDIPDMIASMVNLASAYKSAGKLDRALPLWEETLALQKSHLGPDNPNTLAVMSNLAAAYRDAGKLDRALPLFEETLARRMSKLGPDHHDTLMSMNSLGHSYWIAKKLDRSIPLFEECLKRRRVKSGENHPDTILVKANLGVNYMDAGRLAEALRLLEEANRAAREHPTLRFVRGRLMDAYIQAGRNGEAAALAQEMLAESRAALPAGGLQLASMLAQTGLLLLKTKNWAEAEVVVREALTIRDAKEPDEWRTFNTKSMLGGALLGQKKYAEAEPLLKAGYEGMKQRDEKIPPEGKVRLAEALDRLIEFADATGKVENAKKWKEEKAKPHGASTARPDLEKK